MTPARFLFDVGSPFAWLAGERLEAAGLGEATWEPVLLGAIFGATGRSSWARTPRREPGMREVEARAAAYGLGALRWPDGWPASSLTAMRCCVVAAEQGRTAAFALAAMRRQFREAADLADPAVLADAAAEAGVRDVPERAADPAVKAALRERTERALAAGVIGVPTILIGDRAYWGDDQLELAAAAEGLAQRARLRDGKLAAGGSFPRPVDPPA